MAAVELGSGHGKRRSTNSEINMIPFIDLLMVTIAFLFIVLIGPVAHTIRYAAARTARTAVGRAVGRARAWRLDILLPTHSAVSQR